MLSAYPVFYPAFQLNHYGRCALARKGANIKQVQTFLGHESASTTLDIYTHVDMEDARLDGAYLGGM